MKAIRVANHREAEEVGPGAFYYRFDESGKPTHLTFIAPNAVKNADGGNLDSPTCSPSIWVNPPHGWHGFIRNGEWIDA